MTSSHQVVCQVNEGRLRQISAVFELKQFEDIRCFFRLGRLVLDLFELNGKVFLTKVVDDVQKQKLLNAQVQSCSFVDFFVDFLWLFHQISNDIEILI